MTRTLTAAALASALLVAGCSSGGALTPPAGVEETPVATKGATEEPTVEPEETVTPEPEPTPGPISLEEAGQNYLALAEAANQASGDFEIAMEAGDIPAARVASAKIGEALRTFTDGLVAAEWPAEVRPTIDRLVSETAAEIPIWLAAAQTTTDEDFYAELDKVPTTGSANEVRILLGLDNVPVG